MHKNQAGVAKDANTPSTGVQGMLNKAFWGKKKLKPKGKALKKAVVEKEAGEAAIGKDED